MAAPHVTGAAALLLSYSPNLTAEQIKYLILNSANNIIIENENANLLNIGNLMTYLSNSLDLQNAAYYSKGPDCESGRSSGWKVEIKNCKRTEMRVIYNKRMCNENDAKNWTGLKDIGYIDIPAKGTKTVEIEEYGTATHVAFSYVSGSTRYISYATKLDKNINSFVSGMRTATVQSYTQNGMEVNIVGKDGGKWFINLTNNTGSGRTFEYNYRMCNEGDAQNWTGLSHVNSIYLANGQTTSTPLQITEYGTATSIAISYMPDNVYRKIFYAKNLNVSGTMTAMSNTIDTTAPPDSCLAAGSLITLADGSQKAVEDLTGSEMLLVWNMQTGTLDSAPILFIDSDPLHTYDIINLHFSDQTTVKVIYEHGFWDFNLNRYVYMDENAEQYIGHWFNKQSADGWERVQLTDVTFTQEYTTAWSPVTYGHLCYYVNGMLSMPGGIGGMFNVFEVDGETMRYDAAEMQRDIDTYGLFTYEEFSESVEVPEVIFEAINGQYLKVAIGKGLIDIEALNRLAERYAEFF